MANISCNIPHPTAIVCDSGLFRQLSCPVTAAVSHSHHPGWDWGPSLQELRWSTVTQGFLTCSSLGFPQHSPRRLDPYNNLMAAQQRKYQPKDFPSCYPHSLCAQTVWGLPAEPSAPAVSLSVPCLGRTAPGPLRCQGSALPGLSPGLWPHRAQPPIQLLTELPALSVLLQRRACGAAGAPSLPAPAFNPNQPRLGLQRCTGASGAPLWEGFNAAFLIKVSFPGKTDQKSYHFKR